MESHKKEEKSKKQSRLGLEVKKDENFSEWYSQVFYCQTTFNNYLKSNR